MNRLRFLQVALATTLSVAGLAASKKPKVIEPTVDPVLDDLSKTAFPTDYFYGTGTSSAPCKPLTLDELIAAQNKLEEISSRPRIYCGMDSGHAESVPAFTPMYYGEDGKLHVADIAMVEKARECGNNWAIWTAPTS